VAPLLILDAATLLQEFLGRPSSLALRFPSKHLPGDVAGQFSQGVTSPPPKKLSLDWCLVCSFHSISFVAPLVQL